MANLWTIPVLCAKTEGCVAPLQQPLLYFCTPCDPSNDRMNFTHCNSVNHLLPSGYGINQSIRTEELQTNRLHHQTSTNTSSQMWAVNKIHSYVCSQRLWLSVIYFCCLLQKQLKLLKRVKPTAENFWLKNEWILQNPPWKLTVFHHQIKRKTWSHFAYWKMPVFHPL